MRANRASLRTPPGTVGTRLAAGRCWKPAGSAILDGDGRTFAAVREERLGADGDVTLAPVGEDVGPA
jgi:L-ascorbate metabolism protein UlaG (beta-lactamase superfamily)